MTYTIEIINWEWQTTKTNDDRFYFSGNHHPRIKRFRTQKAAREWLESVNFRPVRLYVKGKPFVYRSPQGGMQAHIIEAENNPHSRFPKSARF